jgi:signal transduction histidine kinase
MGGHRPSDCTKVLLAAWRDALSGVSPVVASRAQGGLTEVLVADLSRAILSAPPDATLAGEVGKRLEALEACQPDDLLTLAIALLRASRACLPDDEWPELGTAVVTGLLAMVAGFYVGKAERARQFDTQAVSRLAHDLKGPINVITGFAGVMLKGIDGPVSDLQREDLVLIREAGEQLLAQVNEMTAIARADAQRRFYLPTPYAVGGLVGDIVRTVQPIAAEREIAVQVGIAPSADELRVDPGRARLALLHAVLYLIGHTQGGAIVLTAAREPTAEARVVVDVYLSEEAIATPQSAEAGFEAVLTVCRQICRPLEISVSPLLPEGGFRFSLPHADAVGT